MYIIVRVDSRCVPAIVDYVSEDRARYSHFRTSAERFTKRDAIREAKRLSQVWSWGRFRVVAYAGGETAWTSDSE